jgi:N-acetylmuramoyl-L-alanine amidase
LDRIKSPAVLVECGFLSNPDEAERLSREAYRYAVAAVVFAGVVGGRQIAVYRRQTPAKEGGG